MEGARPATFDDLPAIDSLMSRAREELGPMRGGAVFLAHEARVGPADLDDPSHAVWVGTIDDVVVGYGSGRTEDLRSGVRLGLIDDIYVEPGARGVGVGEALMDGLLAWFREQRCDAVDALALPGNRETKNFFESAGFSARLLVMHRNLGDGGGTS